MRPVVHLDGAGVEVDGGGLVLHAHVDAHGPELVGIPGNTGCSRKSDPPAHQVRNAARRVARPTAPFRRPRSPGPAGDVGACDAAAMPAASPPITSRRSPITETVRAPQRGRRTRSRGRRPSRSRGNMDRMGVRADCRHYVHRSTPAGEALQRCRLAVNQEQPVRLPRRLPVLRGAHRCRPGLDPTAERAHEQHRRRASNALPARTEEAAGPQAPLVSRLTRAGGRVARDGACARTPWPHPRRCPRSVRRRIDVGQRGRRQVVDVVREGPLGETVARRTGDTPAACRTRVGIPDRLAQERRAGCCAARRCRRRAGPGWPPRSIAWASDPAAVGGPPDLGGHPGRAGRP